MSLRGASATAGPEYTSPCPNREQEYARMCSHSILEYKYGTNMGDKV